MENLSQARDTDGCNSSGSEKNMKIQCTVVWFITIKTPILCGDLYRYIYRTVTKMTTHWTAPKTIKMSIFWLMINLGKLLMDIISNIQDVQYIILMYEILAPDSPGPLYFRLSLLSPDTFCLIFSVWVTSKM